MRSFDPPWVVAAGDTTLAAHRLVDADPFSYTATQPWMHHEWLTELSWALVHRAGGWPLANVLAGILVALTGWIVWSTRRSAWSLVPVAVLAAGLRETSDPIAQLFSDVLFALTLKLTLDEERWPRRRLAIALLAIQLVWTQLHGGNPTGPTLLAVWFLARPSLYRGAIAAGSALLTCAGPYGVRVHGHFFAHHESVTFIREFQPLRAALAEASPLHIAFVVWVAVAVAALIVRARRGERIRYEALALAVFFAVTVMYVRIATETAIVATCAILPALKLPDRPRAAAGVALAAFVACILFSARPLGVGLDPSRYPLKTLAWLKQNRPSGPMFNAYNYGGILLEEFPEEKVFIDPRAFTVYSEQQILDLVDVYQHPSKFVALDVRYGFRLVVLPLRGRSTALVDALLAGGHWKQAFTDGLAVVLTRP